MALYSDFDISLEKDTFSRDLVVLEDYNAVRQSVKNLVLTMFYERPFQPSIGSAIYDLLFEPLTELTEMLLQQSIKDVINQFEPRAKVQFVNVYTGTGPNNVQLDDHEIVVDVGFYVYNLPTLTTASVTLRRLR